MKKNYLLIGLLVIAGIIGNGLYSQEYRTETDLLGEIKVPADAYYGAQAARGMENFQISGQYINDYPEFIKAWGMIKLACARANTDVGEMSKDKLKLIEPACEELINGNYINEFQVDLYQGGAGTSTNMNANEVLANIASKKPVTKKETTKRLRQTTSSTCRNLPTTLILLPLNWGCCFKMKTLKKS